MRLEGLVQFEKSNYLIGILGNNLISLKGLFSRSRVSHLKVKDSQERVRKQVALKGPILRLEWIWRINKTITKADGKIVGRKEVLEDKLNKW